MFPRHVLEHMIKASITGPVPSEGLKVSQSQIKRGDDEGLLARSHKHVTIMFMDIVGFTSMSKEVQPFQVRVYPTKSDLALSIRSVLAIDLSSQLLKIYFILSYISIYTKYSFFEFSA